MILKATILIAFLATVWSGSPLPGSRLEWTQSKTELRETLKEKQASLDSKDADGLYKLSLWATQKGLKTESKRLLRKVIKIAPDHRKAREALGYTLHEDKWVKARDLAKLKKNLKEKENEKKGMVKVRSEWVRKEDVDLAKRGYVKIKGEWWRSEDNKKLQKGYAIHPETGTWIRKKDLKKAEKGLFRIQGKWVSTTEADEYHGGWTDPWILQSRDVTLVTDYGLKKAKEILREANTAMVYATKLLWDPRLPLPKRVILRVYRKGSDYRSFSREMDTTGFSAFGCFAVEKNPQHPISVLYGEADWGPYYLKHAAGMGTSLVLLASDDLPITHWIHTGVGCYVERFSNLAHSKYFGRQFEPKGGIRGLSDFWKGFRISSEDDVDRQSWNIYQAGYLIRYLVLSKDKRFKLSRDALREASLSRNPKDGFNAVQTLEALLQSMQGEIAKSLLDLLKS